MRTGFRWGNLRERDYLEDSGLDGDKSKKNLQQWDEEHRLD